MTPRPMTGGQALARQLVREGVQPRVRPPRRPDHARARRPLRRAVDPVRDHPPRAGHHLPRRRLRPRRRSPRRGVRRARRGRVQRRCGAGDRVRGVVAGRVRSPARSTATASARASACCTRSTTSSTSCARSPSWQRRALTADRDPRDRARGVRARAARPPATGRDRDAAGGVLGGRPTSRCSTRPTTCGSPPTPTQIARRGTRAGRRPSDR